MRAPVSTVGRTSLSRSSHFILTPFPRLYGAHVRMGQSQPTTISYPGSKDGMLCRLMRASVGMESFSLLRYVPAVE